MPKAPEAGAVPKPPETGVVPKPPAAGVAPKPPEAGVAPHPVLEDVVFELKPVPIVEPTQTHDLIEQFPLA